MKHNTPTFLNKKKVPKILWKGLIAAAILGWTGWLGLAKVKNYYELKALFPTTSQVSQVLDGDTFRLKNGLDFRLLGLNAPNEGNPNYARSTKYLKNLIENKKIAIEYDTYQDDKYGRNLAYIFLPCGLTNASPLSSKFSQKFTGLATIENNRDALKNFSVIRDPTSASSAYCRNNRILINEVLIKEGYAVSVIYQDRRPLKYADYLSTPAPSPTAY